MDNKNRFICALTPAILAGLMAGCSAYAVVRALGFSSGALPAYLAALLIAYAVGICRGRAVLTALAFGGAIVGAGALLAANSGMIAEGLRALSDPAASSLGQAAQAGMPLSVALGLLLGALFGVLVRSEAGRPFVLLIFLAAIICSLALNESLPLWLALPGLIAGVAAFAVPMGKNEGPRLGAVLPAVVLAALALLIVPAARTTWAPLENLAVRIRAIVEDYVHFTQQRIVFSINEQGYDRAGMVNNVVVAMLGGPADPHEEAVMQVATDHDILLRGAIKRSYTGYSWVDDQVKARYLYYDFTHRRARAEVFDQNRSLDDTAYETVDAQVEFLNEGTSTLFVPAHMEGFSMDLENAVYYNSTGEIFLTRDVAPGDSYAVTGRVPVSREALLEAAGRAEYADDSLFDEMQDIYTALPAGIDSRVYALAVELTQGKATAAQKAYAIEEYLAQNYRYTLEGGVPAAGQDFVSYFLMDAKEGYCSYFASAMTVLCRIAGVPARYVEGYAVKAEEDGVTTVTGEDAHAWVEVYLNGIGWTAYDPTARAEERQAGKEQGSGANISDEPDKQDTPFGDERALDEPIDPTPSPTPTLPPQEPDSDVTAQDTPTPEPDGDTLPDNPPTPTPEPELPDMSGQDQSENPFDSPQDENSLREPDAPARKNRAWLWILIGVLLALVLAALAVLLIRRRLEGTDPVRLAEKAKSAQLASLILYRGILTLLAQMGQAPSSGETPQAFAARVAQVMPNESYEAFVSAVVRSRYSGRPVDKACVDLGKNAYLAFLSGMRRREKLRFIRQRLLHGLGSFELIP